jgi:hypothetical protein
MLADGTVAVTAAVALGLFIALVSAAGGCRPSVCYPMRGGAEFARRQACTVSSAGRAKTESSGTASW